MHRVLRFENVAYHLLHGPLLRETSGLPTNRELTCAQLAREVRLWSGPLLTENKVTDLAGFSGQ